MILILCFFDKGKKASPYGHVLLTPMTLRAKRPSGLTSFTQVTFHHTSWTPAKADEARATRERREIFIRGKEGRRRLSKARFGAWMVL
jgi:hypothetical protein